MGLTGVGQIHVTVSDIAKGVAFYRDVLGLPLLFEVPAQSMAFFQAGAVRLYLGYAESPEFASHPLLYFSTDDIEAEHERLVAAGVEFVSPPHLTHRDDAGELWLAFFLDPDGHHLALMRQRPPVAG